MSRNLVMAFDCHVCGKPALTAVRNLGPLGGHEADYPKGWVEVMHKPLDSGKVETLNLCCPNCVYKWAMDFIAKQPPSASAQMARGSA